MLYLKLSDGINAESEEVAEGVVLDFDNNNKLLGIEIENAASFVDLSRLEVSALPIADLIMRKKSSVTKAFHQ